MQCAVHGHEHGFVFEAACVFGGRQRALDVKALGHKVTNVAMERCEHGQAHTAHVSVCTRNIHARVVNVP